MTATLTFTLPEEAHEHQCAVYAARIVSEMFDLDEQLRSWLKHGHSFKTPDEALEAVRSRLCDTRALIEDLG